MKELEGKVAVVTGAGSGIGRATAELFARQGMRVVLADIDQGTLDTAVAAIVDGGGTATGVVTDVTKFDSVCALRDAIVSAYGTVNLAFLNAGVTGGGAGKAMWDLDLKEWGWPVAVNVWGVIHGIKALVPVMIANGEPGHVVITSSSVGVIAPTPTAAAYNLTKAGNCSLAESLHGQFRTRGLPLSASVLVPPGTINTGLFSALLKRPAEFTPEGPLAPIVTMTYEEMLDRMNKAGNHRRPVQPEEVAAYVLDGVLADRFWLLPDERHDDMRDQFDRIVAARARSIVERTDPTTYMQQAT